MCKIEMIARPNEIVDLYGATTGGKIRSGKKRVTPYELKSDFLRANST